MNGIGTGRPGSPAWWKIVALVALVPAAGSGCKMGTAGTKPSWWAFGNAPNTAADKLAAAPSFTGSVEKPSITAQPYPTTSTPNSYALDDSAKAAAATVAAAPPPAAVTYGVTPPPARPDPVALATSPAAGATPPSAPASAPPLTSVTPQVGPYAALPAEPPAAPAAVPESLASQPLAGGAAPTASAFGAAAQTAPPQRVADARGSSAWPESPSAAGGRYENASSRFGTGGPLADPLPPPASASVLPAPLDPLPPSATPAAMPGGFAPPPAVVPPPAAPGGPVRRPDPGYRPGGTSSYRPSRAILADDSPAADAGGVRTVGFEAPAAAAP